MAGGVFKMSMSFYRFIRKVAKRNGAIQVYPVSSFVGDEDGRRVITCENGAFPGTDAVWLFQDVSEDEARLLLQTFVTDYQGFAFDIGLHFARLLALKGALVESALRARITQTDWSSYAAPNLLLAGLAALSDGAAWIIRLLDVVPNDTRDGLLMACWYCDDDAVHQKLLLAFEHWSADPTWGGGDGEGAWLKAFLARWLKEARFASQRLERLMTIASQRF